MINVRQRHNHAAGRDSANDAKRVAFSDSHNRYRTRYAPCIAPQSMNPHPAPCHSPTSVMTPSKLR